MDKIDKYYDEWTAGDFKQDKPFEKDENNTWRGDMVKGFVSFVLNEEKKRVN